MEIKPLKNQEKIKKEFLLLQRIDKIEECVIHCIHALPVEIIIYSVQGS